MKIRACIFDLGGTIVDRYSRTPFISLKNTFNKYGIILSDKLIYKDMGMYKLNHIQEIMKNPYIFYKFFATTIISSLLWILTYYIISNNFFTL